MTITLEVADKVGVVRMDDGKVNAMQGEFFDGLGEALDSALEQKVRAVVLAGRPACFSAGLDLKRLPTLKPPELRAVLQRFVETMLRVFMFERPVVAALSGHAIAGGCVLALAADRRLAAQGPFRIGLNEVPLGINIPRILLEFSRLALPAHRLSPTLMAGELSEGPQRLEHSWVESIHAPEQLLPRAVALATALGRASTAAYVHAKHMVRAEAADRARAVMNDELDAFATAFQA